MNSDEARLFTGVRPRKWDSGWFAGCAKLAGLTGLKQLVIELGSRLEWEDAGALSTLTGLTLLSLHDAQQGVRDTAAKAIARSLTQLRHLDLAACYLGLPCNEEDDTYEPGGRECLAAIAQLKQLTYLDVSENAFTNEAVMQLTVLTRLRMLKAALLHGLSGEAYSRLEAAMPYAKHC
jgi:hypothetical protein